MFLVLGCNSTNKVRKYYSTRETFRIC